MKYGRVDYRIQDPQGLIPDDEPVFLLRAADSEAPDVVSIWAARAGEAGAEPDIVAMALQQADAMRSWQEEHGSKIPDLPPKGALEAERDVVLEHLGDWNRLDGNVQPGSFADTGSKFPGAQPAGEFYSAVRGWDKGKPAVPERRQAFSEILRELGANGKDSIEGYLRREIDKEGSPGLRPDLEIDEFMKHGREELKASASCNHGTGAAKEPLGLTDPLAEEAADAIESLQQLSHEVHGYGEDPDPEYVDLVARLRAPGAASFADTTGGAS